MIKSGKSPFLRVKYKKGNFGSAKATNHVFSNQQKNSIQSPISTIFAIVQFPGSAKFVLSGTPCTCKFTVDSIEIICLFHLLSECASILTNPIGRIISPGFPQQYYNNIDCSWLIQYHPESFIRLVFLSFDVRCSR